MRLALMMLEVEVIEEDVDNMNAKEYIPLTERLGLPLCRDEVTSLRIG